MLRNTAASLQRIQKQRGVINLKTDFTRTREFNKAKKQRLQSVDGEAVIGRGKIRTRTQDALKEAIGQMEHPAIWMWYPWRKNPEPPTPYMPARRALKNLHGAVFTDLSPMQKKRQEEMLYGINLLPGRKLAFDKKHPLLSSVLRDNEGKAKGFPFWFKKYPTRRHAYETRFQIPKEMLDGYPKEIVKAVSYGMMRTSEKTFAQTSMYTERYAKHDFDTNSYAVLAVKRALKCRILRNHLLTNPHNNIMKSQLANTERALRNSLRRLRKEDFKQYWEIIRDHDVQDVLQPSNLVTYRWGSYWKYDWNAGLAISTNIPDFMDPRGLNGCVETGRSRSEVARDLGLSYTRPLFDHEKKQLSQQATYYEKLAKFKSEQPEAARQAERRRFVKKFSGMFLKQGKKSMAADFPSTYRRLLGVKVTRWKSKRHGPT